MVATGYLLGIDMKEDFEIVWTTIRLPLSLRQKFHAAAMVETMDASNMIRQFMQQKVAEIKQNNPQAFDTALRMVQNEDSGRADKKKKKTSKKAIKKSPDSDIEGYEDMPQTRLFSDGSGKPVTRKKLSDPIKKDIEDATRDAIERTRKKESHGE